MSRGRDPFDDPFFKDPFGSLGMSDMFGRDFLGSSGSLFGGHDAFFNNAMERHRRIHEQFMGRARADHLLGHSRERSVPRRSRPSSDVTVEVVGDDGSSSSTAPTTAPVVTHPTSVHVPGEPSEEVSRPPRRRQHRRSQTWAPHGHSFMGRIFDNHDMPSGFSSREGAGGGGEQPSYTYSYSSESYMSSDGPDGPVMKRVVSERSRNHNGEEESKQLFQDCHIRDGKTVRKVERRIVNGDEHSIIQDVPLDGLRYSGAGDGSRGRMLEDKGGRGAQRQQQQR